MELYDDVKEVHAEETRKEAEAEAKRRRLKRTLIACISLAVAAGLGYAGYYLTRSDTEKMIMAYTKTLKKMPDNEEALAGRAEAYFSIKEYDKALEDSNALLAAAPSSAAAYFLRGTIHLEMDKKPEAESDFKKSSTLDPAYQNKLQESAEAFFADGEFSNALWWFSLLADTHPDDTHLLFMKARSETELGNFDAALTGYAALLASDSGYYEQITETADEYKNKQDYDKAINMYTAALSFNGEDTSSAAVWYSRGTIYFDLGKNAEAEEDFKRSMTLDALYYTEIIKTADEYKNKLDYDKAINLYTAALSFNAEEPSSAAVYYSRGTIYFDLGKNPEAEEDFKQSMSLDPLYYEQIIKTGDEYKDKRDYDKAISLYTAALSFNGEDTSSAAVWYSRGTIYFDLGKNAEAEEDFKQSMALDPLYYAELIKNGDEYKNKHEYDKAINLYTAALSFNAKDSEVYLKRSDSYFAKNDYQNAIADITAILNMNPDDFSLLEKRAGIYFAIRDYDNAAAYYTHIIDNVSEPVPVTAYKNRAEIYFLANNYEKAVSDYSAVINNNAANADIYTRRGKSYLALEEYDKAAADLTSALQSNNENLRETFFGEAEAFYDADKYDEALAYLSALVTVNPSDVTYLEARIGVYESIENYEAALKDLSAILRITPNDYYVLLERAEVYNGLKQYTNAVSDYTKALGIRETVDALLGRAWNFYELKAYDDMIKDANRAIKIDKKASVGYCLLGLAYYSKEKYGDAISNFDKAIKIDSNENSFYYWRGIAHYQKGIDALLFSGSEYRKALEDFGMAIILAPDDADNYIMRARVYIAQKDYVRAVQDFDIAKNKDASRFADFSWEYQQCKAQLQR